MKKHYDFSKAEQGKLYRPMKSLRIPVYLDDDVHQALVGTEKQGGKDLSKLVNKVLRTQLGVAALLK